MIVELHESTVRYGFQKRLRIHMVFTEGPVREPETQREINRCSQDTHTDEESIDRVTENSVDHFR